MRVKLQISDKKPVLEFHSIYRLYLQLTFFWSIIVYILRRYTKMKSWLKNKWNKGKIHGEDHMVEYMQTGYAGDESTLIPTGRVFDAK